MDINKYDLPNFFIRKKYKNPPGTFNLSGNVFYIQNMDSETVEILWGVNIEFPGGSDYINYASTIGNGGWSKEFVAKNFYHVNKLDNWKKQSMIKAIFYDKNEDVINEI